MTDYSKSIADRLTKLAAAESSGMVPITGTPAGAIHLRNGAVVYAESSRTPGPAGVPPQAGAPPQAGVPPQAELDSALGIGESTIDAALDLLSSRSACSRFRALTMTSAEPAALSISVAELLAEVNRRRRLLTQLAGIMPDSALTRTPVLEAHRVQVSALDWALLIRIRTGSTPRDLAWELGRSVFRTTVDAHRLVNLGLLTAAPPSGTRTPALTGSSGRATPGDDGAVSFLKALPDEKGTSVMSKVIKTAPQRRAGA